MTKLIYIVNRKFKQLSKKNVVKRKMHILKFWEYAMYIYICMFMFVYIFIYVYIQCTVHTLYVSVSIKNASYIGIKVKIASLITIYEY